MLAPPRGFSQLAASFVGYQRQGIPRVPFLPFPRSSPYFFPLSPILLSMCMRQSTQMVEMNGFEPSTSCVQGRRSPTELHPQSLPY